MATANRKEESGDWVGVEVTMATVKQNSCYTTGIGGRNRRL